MRNFGRFFHLMLFKASFILLEMLSTIMCNCNFVVLNNSPFPNRTANFCIAVYSYGDKKTKG